MGAGRGETKLTCQREPPVQGLWGRKEVNSGSECTKEETGRGEAGGAGPGSPGKPLDLSEVRGDASGEFIC